MAYSQVEVGGNPLLIRKVVANISNKQFQTANKGWTSNLGGLGVGLKRRAVKSYYTNWLISFRTKTRKCIISLFVILVLRKYYSVHHIKRYEKGRACSMYGRRKGCIQGSVGKPEGKRPLENFGADWNIVLDCEQDERAWTDWYRTEQAQAVGWYEDGNEPLASITGGIISPAEKLLTSREEVRSIGFNSWFQASARGVNEVCSPLGS